MIYQVFLLLCGAWLVASDLYTGEATDTYKRCLQYPPRRRDGYVSIADEEYDWDCIQRSYQNNADFHGIVREQSEEMKAYLRTLFEASLSDTECTPTRTRKEYRMLTDTERATFHRALNALKADRSYDALVLLHSGNPGAHNGPAFTNWHRIYLHMFETALRQKEPDCILPYWASSWDNEMTDPMTSIMWDPRFAGNGNSAVTTGPAANWQCMGSFINRNVGASGGLITQQDVSNVVSQNELNDISSPFAAPQNNLERHHDKVHVYVGGHMGSLSTAPCDPVFFMHHAFIDCIYEEFRLRQIANGNDPNSDWPVTYTPPHAPGAPISLKPEYTNIGVSSRRHACAVYTPKCSQLIRCDCNNPCPSKYLVCDTERSICIPIQGQNAGGGGGTDECCGQNNGYSYGGGPNGGPRSTLYYTPVLSSPESPYRSGNNVGVQNTYCIGMERCGTNYWSYIPIQINTYRPPNQVSYNSYPVEDGYIRQDYDVYDARGYSLETYTEYQVYADIQQNSSPSPPYRNCPCRSTTGGVYVQSYGNTYEGNYREYQPVDYRLPVSTTTSYVAVMNPIYGESQSYVRVYDECGRMCRPRCRVTNSEVYEDCNGIIGITEEGSSDAIRTYGNSQAEAANLLYSYEQKENGRYIPSYNGNNINIIYDCDYRGDWPWAQRADQDYDMEGYEGNTTYRPPVYPDPEEYVRLPRGGYY